MKSKIEVAETNSEIGFSDPPAATPKGFRRLQWNELVSQGDFVVDELQRFEPWEGPGGFRADAFVRPIYRRNAGAATAAKKPK